MSDITLEVQSREETGTNANRRLRAAGLIPAVVYGGDLDPVAIQVDRRGGGIGDFDPVGEAAVAIGERPTVGSHELRDQRLSREHSSAFKQLDI